MRVAALLPSRPPAAAPIAGDSIVQGDAAGVGNRWSDVFGRRLRAAGLRARVYNRGHNGEYSADMLTHYASEVAATYSASGRLSRGSGITGVALLAIGVNDLRTGIAEATLRSRQTTWLSQARADGFDVVGIVTIMHYAGGFSGGADASSFAAARAANRAYWLSQRGGLIDVVGDLDAVPELADSTNLTYFDGTSHPNAAGHALIGEQVANDVIACIAAA